MITHTVKSTTLHTDSAWSFWNAWLSRVKTFGQSTQNSHPITHTHTNALAHTTVDILFLLFLFGMIYHLCFCVPEVLVQLTAMPRIHMIRIFDGRQWISVFRVLFVVAERVMGCFPLIILRLLFCSASSSLCRVRVSISFDLNKYNFFVVVRLSRSVISVSVRSTQTTHARKRARAPAQTHSQSHRNVLYQRERIFRCGQTGRPLRLTKSNSLCFIVTCSVRDDTGANRERAREKKNCRRIRHTHTDTN